jgi:Flp pilus assembly protein TadD
MLGAILDQQKKYAEADPVYRPASSLDPRPPRLLNNWQSSGRERQVDRIAHRVPESPDPESIAGQCAHAARPNRFGAARFIAGAIALTLRDNSAAIDHLRASVLMDPQFAEAHEYLAKAYAAEGRVDDAHRHDTEASNLRRYSCEKRAEQGNLILVLFR